MNKTNGHNDRKRKAEEKEPQSAPEDLKATSEVMENNTIKKAKTDSAPLSSDLDSNGTSRSSKQQGMI